MTARPGWPRILVVTDRHRLTSVCGQPPGAWPWLLGEQIRGALAGGADLVQVREPDLPARALLQFLRDLDRAQPGALASVVVNDRADVALMAGAAGVHLTERSIREQEIVGLPGASGDWIVGRSVHSVDGARTHREVSYLLAGTLQRTISKPSGSPTLGWAGLHDVVLVSAGTPVVAIGGLTEEDVPRLATAGATGIAGIGCFLPEGRGEVAAMVRRRVARVRQAFDTVRDVSYTREPDR